MSATTKCPHPHFGFNIEVAAFDDDTLKVVKLEGKCSACGGGLLFRGAPPGVRWDQPTVAIDGSTIDLVCSVEGDVVDENKKRPSFGVRFGGGGA